MWSSPGFPDGLVKAATAILTATAAPQLDPRAARWVRTTLDEMTLDQKVGQLIMPSFRSTYLSSDSDVYDKLVSLVHEQHVGASTHRVANRCRVRLSSCG